MQEQGRFGRIKAATVAIAGLHPGNRRQPFTIFGSGFCIDPLGIIVTCRHVVAAFLDGQASESVRDGKPDINIISKSRLIHPHAIFFVPHSQTQLHALPCAVDLMMTMRDFDLALLRTPEHVRLPAGYPCVEMEDYESIWDGDEVGTCGFPLGNFLYDQIGTVTSSFTSGIVSSIIPAHGVALELVKGFQLNLTATHGNSGGPVFRIASQRVFGVLQRGVRDQRGNILPGIVKAEPVYPISTPNELTLFKNAPPGQLPKFQAK